MREIDNRMEKFVRFMGVSFKFNIIVHTGDLSELNLVQLDVRKDEAIDVNCIGALHSVPTVSKSREHLISCSKDYNRGS